MISQTLLLQQNVWQPKYIHEIAQMIGCMVINVFIYSGLNIFGGINLFFVAECSYNVVYLL